MKSYTDIEQSKKLVGILPIESADMRYAYIAPYKPYSCDDIVYIIIDFGKPSDIDIPAWSLAALLDVLPSAILDSSDDHQFRLHCMEKFTEWYDNPIDACYELVLKLHELKML